MRRASSILGTMKTMILFRDLGVTILRTGGTTTMIMGTLMMVITMDFIMTHLVLHMESMMMKMRIGAGASNTSMSASNKQQFLED